MEEIVFTNRSMKISHDLADLETLISGRKCLLLYQRGTDQFKEALPLSLSEKIVSLEVPEGDRCKTLETAGEIIELLALEHFSKSDTVLALGGGSLSDLAGFVASVFKRGIGCIFIPTTLLSMVDASIGGKNGLNFAEMKNIIGTFYQPDAVIIHLQYLSGLPDDQYISGMAEVLKYAASLDREFYLNLLGNKAKVQKRDQNTMMYVIKKCISLKIAVVRRDEFETKGIREVLNFGHTIGHAIEAATGFTLSHGRAVAAGMLIECAISEHHGITKPGTLSQIEELLKQFIPSVMEVETDNNLMKFIRNDKKIRNNRIRLPVLEQIGRIRIEDIGIDRFEEVYNEVQIRAHWK